MIRILLLCFSLALTGCIVIKDENGYWDKAIVDKTLVGDWLKTDKTSLITVKNYADQYLEVFEENEKILDMKTLARGPKNYLITRTYLPHEATETNFAFYTVKGEEATVYEMDLGNPAVKVIFDLKKKASLFDTLNLGKLDEKTLQQIDSIFAQPKLFTKQLRYKRCNQACRKSFEKAQAKSTAP